jgi:outer membrane receptor for monomeric catechols
MPAGMLRTITVALAAICLSDGALAADGAGPRYPQAQGSVTQPANSLKPRPRATSWRPKAARTLASDRDPYADPAAPYKADRLSLPYAAQPIINIPGQVTVLTRQVLDDKNATTVRDALRTTAGVTIGR